MKKKRISFIELCKMITEDRQPDTIVYDGYKFDWDGEEYYSEDAGSYITDMDGFASLINNGQFEYPVTILDGAERNYLRNVILPFIDDVVTISKDSCNGKEAIYVYTPGSIMKFPSFEKGKMYAGMQDGKSYTPAELGIKK